MDERLRHLMAMAKEHYDKQEYDLAEPFLVQIAGVQEGYADLHNMLGVIYSHQGRFAEAEAAFERALQINPAYTEAALNLAVTYNDLGKYSEARAVYERTLAASRGAPRQLDPFARGKLANMHAEVGDAYHDLGLYDEAIGEYRRALTLAPQFPDVRNRLAQTLRDMGNIEGAAVELLEAKRQNPHYMPARVNLGLAYFSLGRRADAVREWESVLAEDPGNKYCRMYLQMVRGG